MAADGFSRTSDRQKFGVVAIQSQAGAENALGGIAQAYADNVPVLMLPGGVFLNQIGVKPNFSASQHYSHITKNVEAILAMGTAPLRGFALILAIPGYFWVGCVPGGWAGLKNNYFAPQRRQQ